MLRRLTVPLLLGLALGASTAPATAAPGDAVLWACHGPSGQPLGSTGITEAFTGEAITTPYGGGCLGAAGTIADGGLRATFTRTDPSGASQASLLVAVPANTSLTSVRAARRTAGFGAGSLAGTPGGLTATLRTSTTVLERHEIDSASDTPVDGVLDTAATGGWVRLAAACELPSVSRCAPPAATPGVPLRADLGSLALRVRDDSAPVAAVGGLANPAAGIQRLTVRATDAGLGLATATASVDGAAAATANLAPAACADLAPGDDVIDLPIGAKCAGAVADVPLNLDTAALADGRHRVTVIVRDLAGNTVTALDEDVLVRNTLPSSTSTATLTLGTGDGPGGGTAGSGGGAGAATATPGPACRSPRLTMALSQKPLRRSNGVPVLQARQRYRFRGRLTCVVAGTRVAAQLGTGIELAAVVRGRRYAKSGTTVRGDGSATMIAAFPSSRTLEFFHRSVDGTVARVRVPIKVVKRKAA